MRDHTFLITFANQLASPTHIACFANLREDSVSWVPLPSELTKIIGRTMGASGACFLSPNMAAICTHEPNPYVFLLRLPDMEIIHARKLDRVIDAHSIAFYREGLYLVSTGTNAIFRLQLNGATLGEEELFWQYPNVSAASDEVHLNGITPFNETLIASCFGEKQSGNKVRNGKIFFTDTGEAIVENLNQPHTPLFSANKLFIAESATGKILIFDHERERLFKFAAAIETGGYPRGLVRSGDSLFVGISSTRNISKSQQKMLVNQETSNVTSMVKIDLRDFSSKTIFNLQPFAREIYDLVIFDNTFPLSQNFAALGSRVLEMEVVAERYFNNFQIANEEIHRQQIEIRSLRSSLSWKVTAPLRWVADKIGYGKKTKQSN